MDSDPATCAVTKTFCLVSGATGHRATSSERALPSGHPPAGATPRPAGLSARNHSAPPSARLTCIPVVERDRPRFAILITAPVSTGPALRPTVLNLLSTSFSIPRPRPCTTVPALTVSPAHSAHTFPRPSCPRPVLPLQLAPEASEGLRVGVRYVSSNTSSFAFGSCTRTRSSSVSPLGSGWGVSEVGPVRSLNGGHRPGRMLRLWFRSLCLGRILGALWIWSSESELPLSLRAPLGGQSCRANEKGTDPSHLSSLLFSTLQPAVTCRVHGGEWPESPIRSPLPSCAHQGCQERISLLGPGTLSDLPDGRALLPNQTNLGPLA